MENVISKLYTLIVLIIPIFSQYNSGIPGLSVSDVLLVLCIPLILVYIIDEGYKLNINRIACNPFLWLAVYVIFGSLLSITTQYYASTMDIFTRSVRFVFYIYCTAVLSKKYFNFNYFMKWYQSLVLLATIYLFLQVVLFETHGIILKGTIPGLKIANEGYDFEVMKRLYSTFHRPSSIFLEPGYYAQFVLPYLAYCLYFIENTSKKTIIAVFITTGILLSTSGQGIVIGAFIWGMWLLSISYNFETKKVKLFSILISLIVLSFLPKILNIEKVQRSLNRLWGAPGASSESRIFRGYLIYNQLKPLYKVIGVGYGNVGAHIAYNRIYSIYDQRGVVYEYMNSVAYILVNLGIVGCILMLWVFFYLWKNTRGFYRTLVYVLVLLSSVSTFFLYSSMIFYISIILSGFIDLRREDNQLSESVI
jgi:hypothetical protein